MDFSANFIDNIPKFLVLATVLAAGSWWIVWSINRSINKEDK
jgi:hypothetical protein